MFSKYGSIKGGGSQALLHGVKLPSDRHKGPYVAALVLVKLLWCFGLFMSFDVLREMHIATFALSISFISSILFVIIQRPFTSGPRISRHVMLRILLCGGLCAVRSILYYFGLVLCGPSRTLLLADYTPSTLVTIVGTMFLSSKQPIPAARFRGNVMCVIAIVVLWLWEEPEATHTVDHVENTVVVHQDYHTVRHNKYFGWLMASDSTVGCIFLLASAFLTVMIESISRKLSVEVEGAKRSRSLVEVATCLFLLPFAFLQSALSADIVVENMMDTTTLWTILLCCALLTQVFDFYVDKLALQHLESSNVSFIGLLASFAGAMVLQNIYATEGTISLPTVIAFLLLLFGSKLLADTSKNTPGQASSTSSRGPLLGYAPSGLPLYHFPASGNAANLVSAIKQSLKSVMESTDSRQIFYFLCLNFVFMLTEFTYGLSTNSLGLIGDAFHMLFDCVALVVGLYAAVLSKWKPSRVFSYGYARVEVLSGFANSVFLVLITVGVLVEAIQRMFMPEEVKTERLLLVSVMGLMVNLVGMFAFSHAHAASHGHGGKPCTHAHGAAPQAQAAPLSAVVSTAAPAAGACHGHSHAGGQHGHSHAPASPPAKRQILPSAQGQVEQKSGRNANMEGVFLHVLADTLGSVGVIISSILIEHFGLVIADPICSLFISALIFGHAIPLLKKSAAVLLLRTPEDLDNIPSALKKIKSLDGVLGCKDPHFWQHTQDDTMCSIHVICERASNPQRILSQVSAIIKDLGVSQYTIQVTPEDSFGKRNEEQQLVGISPYEANQVYNIY